MRYGATRECKLNLERSWSRSNQMDRPKRAEFSSETSSSLSMAFGSRTRMIFSPSWAPTASARASRCNWCAAARLSTNRSRSASAVSKMKKKRADRMNAVNLAAQSAPDALSELAQRLRRSTVQVRAGRSGAGSGIVWRKDGLIVTNAHVVHGRRLKVDLPNGDSRDAELVAADPRRDLAALRVQAQGLEAAQVGDSDRVRPGELAFAVGNPLGLVGAVTAGIVVAAGSSSSSRSRWIQADVRIAPGNSGGPLADARGRVIGVNSMIYGGLAIAVPSNAVERFLRSGRSRPRLGVTVEQVQVRVAGNAIAPALLIFEIADGGAAER